jgi:hypothetical protein
MTAKLPSIQIVRPSRADEGLYAEVDLLRAELSDSLRSHLKTCQQASDLIEQLKAEKRSRMKTILNFAAYRQKLWACLLLYFVIGVVVGMTFSAVMGREQAVQSLIDRPSLSPEQAEHLSH